MAEGKDIEIRMKATADTAGAQRMEEALKGVQDAGGAVSGISEENAAILKAAGEEHAAAMEKARAATTELFEGLGKISEGLEEVSEAGEEANEQASEMEENVKKITRAQMMGAIAQLTEKVGQIGGKFHEAAGEMEEFDSSAAQAMRDTGDRIQNVTSAVSTLAQGFAAGGPVGAGVAAVTIGVKLMVDAFMAAEIAAAKAAAVQQQAMEDAAQATREAASAAREHASEMKSEDVRNAIERENEALAEQLDLLDENLRLNREKRSEQEEIAKAQDDLNLARITEDEATKKITPEQAAKQKDDITRAASGRVRDERKTRAEEDAGIAAEKSKAAQDELLKKEVAAAQAAAEEDTARKLAAEKAAEVRARQAEVDGKKKIVDAGKPMIPMFVSEYPSPGEVDETRQAQEGQERYDRAAAELPKAEARLRDTLPEKTSSEEDVITRAADRKLRTDEAEKARRAAAEAATAEQVAKDKAARTANVVDAVGERENAARDAQARAREARKAEEEERRAEEEASRNRPKRPQQTRSDLAEEEAVAVGAADRALEGTRGSRFYPPTDKARKALEDGASGDELSEYAAEMDSLAGAITSLDTKRRAEIRDAAKMIRNVAERVKRLENE